MIPKRALAFLAAFMVLVASPAFARDVVSVRSVQFFDRITILKNAIQQLEREFEPQMRELNHLGGRLAALDSELAAMRARNAPEQEMAPKVAEFTRLKSAFEDKRNVTSAAYQRRSSIVMIPLQDKVQVGLSAYLGLQGLDVDVIDADQPGPGGVPVGTPDITAPFAAWFNAQP